MGWVFTISDMRCGITQNKIKLGNYQGCEEVNDQSLARRPTNKASSQRHPLFLTQTGAQMRTQKIQSP
jgi:hypothetical protein